MGIHEDVEDLKSQIKRSVASNNKKEIGELLKQAFSLCEKIKNLLKTASAEEKKELSKVMQGLREFLAEETSKMSKKLGLTEDQLARYNENPENFSKEQWIVMQSIKKQFSGQTKEIRKIAKQQEAGIRSVKIEGLPENWAELIEGNPNITKLPPSFPSSTKKKKVQVKRTKRSKWMKS